MNTTTKDGPFRVYEQFQCADGKVEYRWLWLYWAKGERRFALTEEAARSAMGS